MQYLLSQKEETEEEEEEAEIIMCLWADQPGAGTEAGTGGNALAMLQEVTLLVRKPFEAEKLPQKKQSVGALLAVYVLHLAVISFMRSRLAPI